MRTRMLLSASAIALVAASCSQPEPQVLSEAPRSTTATDLTSTTEPTSRESEPGRFIARCSTEADGGTPGMTVFTDGSQGVTDHCLSRYYIGVQPAPGALYVPDDDSGTYAPTRGSETDTSTSSQQWTPAQPRTDAGPDDDAQIDRNDERNGEQDPRGTDARPTPDASETDSPESETGASTPTETEDTTAPDEDTTTPGDQTTTPGDQTTTPGEPTDGEAQPTPPVATDPTPPGSSEPPTTVPVPTVTEGAEESGPPSPSAPTSDTSSAPSGPEGSIGSGPLPGSSSGSHDLPPLFGSENPAQPTTVPTQP